jgi:hypothetical protein
MHVSDLRDFIDGEKTTLRDIEGIFRALVGWPHEEVIEGATAKELAAALDRACEELANDTSILPGGTLDLILEVAPEDDRDAAGTYSYAVEVVRMCPGIWRDRIFLHAGASV